MKLITHFKKQRARTWLLLGLSIVGLLGIVFGYISYQDRQRHNKLSRSMSELEQLLKPYGFKKSEGCGQTQVKFGAGATVCSISISFGSVVIMLEAEEIIQNFNNSVTTLADFRAMESFGEGVYEPNSTLGIKYAYYEHVPTGKICGGTSSYSKSEEYYSLSFSCDNTSWFTRTFRNGQFSF